jgi:hypothetical protein
MFPGFCNQDTTLQEMSNDIEIWNLIESLIKFGTDLTIPTSLPPYTTLENASTCKIFDQEIPHPGVYDESLPAPKRALRLISAWMPLAYYP